MLRHEASLKDSEASAKSAFSAGNIGLLSRKMLPA